MKKNMQCCAGVLFAFALLFLCPGFSPVFASAGVGAVHDDVHQGVHHDVVSADEEGHASAAAHGEGHDGHGAILTAKKIKDLGWRVVNFIALMIILVFFGAKPLGGTLSSRKKQIESEIAVLEQRKADAEKSYNEFQEKIAAVESDIDNIVKRATAQAETEKERILEKAEAAAEELKRSTEQAVANEVTEARATLREEVAEKAAAMAEEIINKNLKDEDQKTIIENYLDKVGAMS